jgi:hypothetical protein
MARETHGRIQGRTGVKLRQRRLQRTNYLCEDCLEEGKTTLATIVDHVQALAFGGEDVDENTRNLCDWHNAIKTALEGASTGGAARHPDWLKPSAIPLTILSGPPCSGKTTYIRERASDHDIIIDLDGIFQRIQPGYVHWSKMLTDDLFNKGIRVRNEMLGSLSRQTSGKAWFIVSAPSKAERDWWHGKLGGELVLLHPGVEECKRRAIERGTPDAVDGVDQWERNSRTPWQPKITKPKAKQITGLDGWPE